MERNFIHVKDGNHKIPCFSCWGDWNDWSDCKEDKIMQHFLGTKLLYACNKGNYKLAEEAIDAGAKVDTKNDFGFTALMSASYSGFVEIAELLINAGAKINAKETDGITALSLA